MDAVDVNARADLVGTPELAETVAGEPLDVEERRRRFESLHFAIRNRKLVVGLIVVLFFLVLAVIGPWLTDNDPFGFDAPLSQPPSCRASTRTTAAGSAARRTRMGRCR